MKRLIFFYILIRSANCFAQQVIPVKDFYAVTHTNIQLNKVYSLPANVFGGGFFEAKEKSNYIIDSGIVLPTAKPNIVLVRKMNDKHIVQMSWFNIKDSTHNFMPAFRKATAYLNTIGGGDIYFPAGTFLAEPYFVVNASNIHIKGAGMDKTFIKVSEQATEGIAINANYRDKGWMLKADDMITYKEDALNANQPFINLKVKTNINKLQPGTIIFINGGANYFDQNYGEFNIVDHCDNTGRVYLKYKLSRSYTQAVSSWAATLSQDFMSPAEGANATVSYTGTQPRPGTAISIGNDLYSVVSSTANSIVVTNTANKGNSKKMIPAGTHIFKYRAIVLPSSVVQNVTVEDMTITGKRKAINVSNTFSTRFNRVRINWLPQPTSTGGLWLDGDDGRDFTMTNCEVNCPYLFTAQMARSFTDIYIDHSTFNQAGIQFTEYNINANVTNCIFNLSANNVTGEINSSVILLGNTVNAINFSNNIIKANNLRNLFYSGEIQGTKAVISSNIVINSNKIICNNVGTLFAGSYPGNVTISNNNISGSVSYLFNIHSYKTISNPAPFCVFKNNNFSGKIDGFGAAATNVQYINNSIKRTGETSASNEYNSWGNVLYTHFTKDTSVENFVCRDNSFFNWNLRPNSFSHYWSLNSKVDISNNHFFTAAKDSIVSLTPRRSK